MQAFVCTQIFTALLFFEVTMFFKINRPPNNLKQSYSFYPIAQLRDVAYAWLFAYLSPILIGHTNLTNFLFIFIKNRFCFLSIFSNILIFLFPPDFNVIQFSLYWTILNLNLTIATCSSLLKIFWLLITLGMLKQVSKQTP